MTGAQFNFLIRILLTILTVLMKSAPTGALNENDWLNLEELENTDYYS